MLKFNIQNQIITRTDNFSVVGDSRKYLKAHFSFSEEWDGINTAIFKNGEDVFCVVLPDDNLCLVPWEVIKPPYFTVSVFGGDLITANIVSVAVEKSGYTEGETPEEPTPDVYTQILQKLDELSNKEGGGTSVEIDKTLSKEGAAADAKAVGDALGDIETALDDIIEIQNTHIYGDVNSVSKGGDNV